MESTGVVWTVVSLLVFCSLTSAVNAPPKVSCRNTNNREVDWFILYKVPTNNVRGQTGLEYIYLDPKVSMIICSEPINDPNGVLAKTLEPMLISVTKMTNTFGFLSYSDQPPNKRNADSKFGHSKGVVLGDSSDGSALWLTHSTPKFPYSHSLDDFYPDSGIKFGQIFMCVSLDFSQLQTVGKHLQRIRAFPFENTLPDNFPEELKKAARMETDDNNLGKFQTLKTRGKLELKLMAKQITEAATRTVAASEGDLFVQLSRELESPVDAQTYGRQDGKDGSYCETDRIKVENVNTVRIAIKGWAWNTSSDHSKWAVTRDSINNIHWTCIADMNRAVTQYERWGGALCIGDFFVHNIFKDFLFPGFECYQRNRKRQRGEYK